ncbi:MAG: porin family protein [Gammaproteobacteria bacterium]|nr:porin family protein [Gammaproteobacteria bacterium]
MNTPLLQALPALLLSIASVLIPAQAQAERGDLTASLKFAQVQADKFSFDDGSSVPLKGETGFGLAIGYEYDANWTAEFQVLKSSAKGEANFSNATIDEMSMGVFAVYRTTRELSSPYFIGKIGFTKSDTELKANGATAKGDESGLSYGAGAGYQYTERLAFEAEYYVDSDVFSYIMVSARYHIQ